MATSGPNQATAVSEFDDGWVAWSDTANAKTSDNSCGTVSLDASEAPFSNFLDYTTFGAFDGVSAGDSVTAITVEWETKISSGTATFITLQILKDGSPVGDPVSIGQSISTSEGFVSTGPITLVELGTTLVGSELASTLGVRVQAFAVDGTFVLSADSCQATVTYTPSGGGGTTHNLLLLGCGT